jgi:cell division septation protein DedD
MGGDDGAPRARSPRAQIAVIAVIVVIAAGVLLGRFAPWKQAPKPGRNTFHATSDSSETAADATPAQNQAPHSAPAPVAQKPADVARAASDSAAHAAAPVMTVASTKNAAPQSGNSESAPTGKPAATAPAITPPVAASTLAPATTKPAPVAATSTKPAPAPAEKPSHAGYGIAVSTWMDASRAGKERDKLAGASQLPVSVSEVVDGGATVYQLVVGPFDTRATAEQNASELIKRGLVDEARVISLTKAKK